MALQLDKRITFGLMSAALFQLGSLVWYIATQAQQDEFRDFRLTRAEASIVQQTTTLNDTAQRLARIETKIESQVELMKLINQKLENK